MLAANTFAQSLDTVTVDTSTNLLESFGPKVKYYERSIELDRGCNAFQNYMDSLSARYPKANRIELEQIAVNDPRAYDAQALSQDPACRFKETTLTEGTCLVSKINPEQAEGITGICYTKAFYVKNPEGEFFSAAITKKGNNIVFLGWPFNRHACVKLIEYVNRVLPICK